MASAIRKGKISKKFPPSPFTQIDKKLSDIAMICTIEKQRSSPRTAGDGMEQDISSEVRPASPKQEEMSSEIPLPVKRKEPKFVPYEPYRAAVTPIVPASNHKHSKSPMLKETRIPFPLVDVVGSEFVGNSQVPVMTVLRDTIAPDMCYSNNAIIVDAAVYQAERDDWEAEKLKMEEDIRQLRNGKRDIENQFKIQTQVNRELKKLLVASMGEDMQSRVQFLSEDKARLAQDISRYSQRLLEDNEELERRAIHCDVWRSKFLACSLMVDELAGWKALLSRNFEEAKEAITWLLDERRDMKQHQMVLHRNLKQLQDAFDPSAMKGPCSDTPSSLLQVSQGNSQLAEKIHFRLLGSTASGRTYTSDGWSCDKQTPAEELAQKVLASKDVCLENLSALDSIENRSRLKICRFHARSEQVTMNCCRHCLGEIDVV